MEGELIMAERKSRYKEVPGKYGKAKVVDETSDAVTEELKKEEVKEVKKRTPKKPVKKGVVDTNALNIRTTPDANANNVMGVLRKGAEVVINEADNIEGWFNVTCEVVRGVKVTGYVMSTYIKEV